MEVVMRSRVLLVIVALGIPLTLAACGNTTEDRAVSGAGIGAAGGAVIGAVTPVGPVGGALIGAAVGGATGALTDSSQVNLGKPAWRKGSSSSSTHPRAASVGASEYDATTVRRIQANLQRRGYHVGAVDGRLGRRTEAAIRRYQQKNGLPVDGQPSAALWDHMQSHSAG
jgi:peptidoglycan hydrolase-like protein with peptidoglycan-binding domain